MEQYERIHRITPSKNPCALTVGKFEGIHKGHQKLFRRLSAYAEENSLESTVVAFENDPRDLTQSSDHIEGMLYPLEERAEFIKECGISRIIFTPFNEDIAAIPAEEFINDFVVARMSAGYFICGEDFRFGKNARGDVQLAQKICAQNNCVMEIEEPIKINGEKISSTEVCRLIINSKFEKASTMLGREYALTGKVIPGRGRGRELGFPTLNLEFSDTLLIPQGIFAGWTYIGSKRYPAAINSGTRPTFEQSGRVLVEAHILDSRFSGPVPEISICPKAKLREEEKFASEQKLINRIREDCEQARAYLESSREV